MRLTAVHVYANGFLYQQRESFGADGEVAECLRLGKPVFYSVEEVAEWLAAREAAR
jgi:hypothetical protein